MYRHIFMFLSDGWNVATTGCSISAVITEFLIPLELLSKVMFDGNSGGTGEDHREREGREKKSRERGRRIAHERR